MFICNQMLLQRISNNKGLSLVAVVIVMLIVATIALLIASFMSSGNISAITDMQAEQAFYIANAGIECYLELLEADTDWSTPPTVFTNQAFGLGTFTIIYANQATDSIDITSTGRVTGWDGNSIQRVITQHAAKNSGPSFGDYIIFCNGGTGVGTSTIGNTTTVTGDIFVNRDLTLNINCTVTGNLLATGNINLENGVTVSGSVIPNTTAPASQPTLTTTYYDNLITVAEAQPSGNVTYDNDTISGTVYIDGNVIIKNTLTGPGTIVTTGTVSIRNGATVGDNITIIADKAITMQLNTDALKNTFFYSSANINVNGNNIIASGAGIEEGAVFLSPGDIDIAHDANVTGFVFGDDISLGNTVTFTGNMCGSRLLSVAHHSNITKDNTKVDYGSINGFSAVTVVTSLWQESL
ncbi:MAG: hypothetical protein KKB22_06630 [Candidatus Omnitrophica bacterium]|nr:hypothetical protein [Candidatus Omnitrophota bacterium]